MSAHNWDVVCGEILNGSLPIVIGNDFGPCFLRILSSGIYLPLIVSCTIYSVILWRTISRRDALSAAYETLVRIRQMALIMLMGSSAARIACQIANTHSIAYILYIQCALSTSTWLLYCVYVAASRKTFPRYVRGHGFVLIPYGLCCLMDFVWLRSTLLGRLVSARNDWFADANYFLAFAGVFFHILLISSFIPSAEDLLARTITVGAINERTPLLHGVATSTPPRAELQRGESGSFLSRLTFWWVNPLVHAGHRRALRGGADTFCLPPSMEAGVVRELFAAKLLASTVRTTVAEDVKVNAPPSLLRAMHQSFGCAYYAAGGLKLAADTLGFCGPLLLGGIVTYAEDPNAPSSYGVLYAAGLFGSTLVGSFLSAHFDYLVQIVGLKIRAALVTAVYSRILAARAASTARFSAGELVNFMSTDADRIVNFCPSFHQFWSLPFQIAVSLYLLYSQVGIASLAGLAFALVLIPVNRWIAVKIGSLSTAMMAQKDGRVKVMTELLYGIRSIKMLAWEPHFRRRLGALRTVELHSLRGRKYLDALCVYFWATTPVLISILTFAVYSLLGHQLTAAKVFTSLSLFNMLIGPLNAFPWVINGLMEAWVSLKRVQAFMMVPESGLPIADAAHRLAADQGCAIVLNDATLSWTEDSDGTAGINTPGHGAAGIGTPGNAFLLHRINLCVRQGSLTGVIGTIGSGKSSLLAAITGEMALLQQSQAGGIASVLLLPVDAAARAPTVAVVPQTAWLQRGSARDNILFGRAYDAMRYERVVQACALTDDFRVLSNGDMSEVGENGSMLSGGQRARLTLARAVYQDKDIYLLDDPLAAVDAKVAAHIFDNCIMGILADKTRVLCTHHTRFLRQAHQVVALDDGHLIAAGLPEDILPKYAATDDNERPTKLAPEGADGQSESSEKGVALFDSEEGAGAVVKDDDEEEAKAEGRVHLSVYKAYASAVGRALSFLVLLSMLLMQGSKNVNDWWLSYWVSHSTADGKNGSGIATSGNSFNSTSNFLVVYGGLAGANTIFTLARAFLFAYGGLRAASVVHDRLLDVVLEAPVAFFDATPTGRIVNRFSSDVYTVDDSLPFITNILLAQTFSIVGTLALTCYGLPWFLLVLVPLALVYYRVQGYYRQSSRELKRISSVTLSSLYSHLSESVEGRAVIRAFDEVERFQQKNLHCLDLNLRAQFSSLAASQWLNIRLQALGVAMVTAVAILAVVEHRFGVVNPGLVGLAISYALSITGLLSGVVSSFTETEKQMVAVERAKQYIDGIKPERKDGAMQVSSVWPDRGLVEFCGVKVRYADSLPLALNNVTFAVAPGERVGIVGRTGSGKSSLFNALYRTVELAAGSVLVDGVNVSLVSLASLRSRLAIIPQTPFLFSGTVRDNLDPSGCHTDSDLWDALDKCHLKAAVLRLTNAAGGRGLDGELPERGRSLSVGQSQLFCLARTLLAGSRVLCIDEGTANVDRDTDRLVQETIRREFAAASVMTIAHRVETVLDYDRIVVLSHGVVVETGRPETLMRDASSFLWSSLRER